MRNHFLLAATGAVLLAGAAGQAQPSGAWPAPSPDPLRFASLPLDPGGASASPALGWHVAATAGYFNTWYLTWHPGAIHRELALQGRPLTSAELRTLESRHPNDEIFFADFEGWRTDVRITRSFASGMAVSLDVPWVDTTGPHWDAVAEEFHASIQAGPGGRDLFPRGRNAFYVRGKGGAYLERLDGLDDSGLGDIALSVAGNLGSALGAEHRWEVAVEAPTGDAGTLRGSGGWDVGVRWYGTWRWTRSELDAAIGYTRLDRAGSFLGIDRDDTWHLAGSYRVALGSRTEGRVIGRLDASPLSSFTTSHVGEPGFLLTLGVRREIGAGWVAFDLGENYPLLGVTPDYSFHLSAGMRLAGEAVTRIRP